MRLFNSSGNSVYRLNLSVTNGELINVQNETANLLNGLTDYKTGIIFALVDVRLQVNLSNFEQAIIPTINAEYSSARRVSETNTSELNSARLGIEFFINSQSILTKRIVNYGKRNTIPLLSKFAGTAKYLNPNYLLSVALFDLGYGLITGNDYIDVTCDYLVDVSGFKINDDLLMRFEDE